MRKLKQCSFCEKETYLWKSNPAACKTCWQREQAKTPKGNKSPARSSIKPKLRKATGEYALFLKIYSERKGLCEVTGEQIPFDIGSMAHILSKGAYPSYRLNPNNLIMVKKEIHDLYDNSSKEKLLAKYPKAIIIYERKDKLRYQYYNS